MPPFAQKVTTDLPNPNPNPSQPWPPLTARICLAQTRLLGLVDRFAARGNYAPLQAAHDLLHYWLSTPVPVLAYEADADQLHAVDLLIDSLSEVYPITSLPTVVTDEPLRLRGKNSLRLSPAFLNRFELSEEEEARAGLIVVPDESMAPQLTAGNEVLAIAHDREQYGAIAGIVVFVMNFDLSRRFIGRVVQGDATSLLVLRDNPEFAEVTIPIAEIHFMASVRYILSRPVL